jgi:hypothetical protein
MKRFGDEAYFDILVQAVPPHIVDVGPAWEFLPPPVEPEGRLFRAVFFVEAREPKGTTRSGQEYANPLIKLTGQEYHDVRFVDLIMRLEDALDARYGVAAWKAHVDPGGVR